MQKSLIANLYTLVRISVRVLAVMMVFVIIMGVVDVGWTIYQKLTTPPLFILTIADMLATFGAFIAVLIAIEILVNITAYLRNDVIQVKVVIATALMAIARKVIILDFDEVEATYVFAIGVVVVAMGLAYWMVHQVPYAKEKPEKVEAETGENIDL
ncbi:phosphate-starvation-inducible PsiE family protein [Proteobacteria bacterium 005FR1]|nr:phosphate-starvation-inducible PsiE family protein [Proteobacteria bacterium 005FR1]